MMLRGRHRGLLASRLAPYLAILLSVSAGCGSFRPADPSRLNSSVSIYADEVWPPRYAETLVPDNAEVRSMRRTFGNLTRDGFEFFGRGPVRANDLGSFGVGRVARVEVPNPPLPGINHDWAAMYWAVTSTLAPEDLADLVSEQGPDVHVGTTTRLTVGRLFKPARGVRARGLVVHQTGITGYKVEQTMLRNLRRRGWAVLVITPPANIMDREEILVGRRMLAIGEGEEIATIDEAGRVLAALVDDRFAEWGYACEALLLAIEQEYPEIPQRPGVLMGLSLGAIVLPATAARLGDRFDAAVLIAGGSNFLEIVRTSSLGRGGVRLTVDGEPATPEQWGELVEAYLKHSRLDPHNAARVLRSMPVLMLHATMDRIVDAERGQELFERLGRPDLLAYPLGHLGISWLLPMFGPRVADWLDLHAPASTGDGG